MIFRRSDPPPLKEAAAPTAAPAAASGAALPPAPTLPSPSNEAPAPAAAPPSPQPQRERQAVTVRYVDRLDVTETFADSVSSLVFDGQSLRIEFAVTRLDEIKPDTPISGRRYPACRLVLPPAAALDLINRAQQVAAALAQAGGARTPPRPAETAKAG